MIHPPSPPLEGGVVTIIVVTPIAVAFAMAAKAIGVRNACDVGVTGVRVRDGARDTVAAIPAIARAGPSARRHAASRMGAATTMIVQAGIT